MKLTDIVWTTAIIAAAILLTAVLSTASLRAADAGAGGTVTAPQGKAGKAAQIARGK